MDEEVLTGLNARLGLGIRDMDLLEKALCTDRVVCGNEGFNEGECRNCALAEVGDAVLELVLSETLYREGKKGRRIADVRKSGERRMLLRRIAEDEGIDIPENTDGRFMEAVIGVKMMDSGYFGCRDWIDRWLRPRMTELMGKGFEDCPAKEERRRCSNGSDDSRWI